MVERYFPVGKRIQSALSTKKVEFNQICRDKTGSGTYDTVYINDSNTVAVSSGWDNRCITIIDIESQEVMTSISMDTSFLAWLLEVEQLLCIG